MPLTKSPSNEARRNNIKEMLAAGHPLAQSLAAAYATQRKAGGAPPPPKPKPAK
jgi:hypothetical protein